MAQLMKLIDATRKGEGVSRERFANNVGITTSSYWRQLNGKTTVGIESVQLYAQYALEHGHTDMLHALGAYALGVPVGKIKIE